MFLEVFLLMISLLSKDLFICFTTSLGGALLLWGLPDWGFLFFLDEISLSVMVLTSFVVSISLFISSSTRRSWCLVAAFFICSFFFLTKEPVTFFVSFELSVLPLFIIILSGGSNPERVSAALYMMLFTLLFSVPLFVFSIFLSKSGIFVNGVGEFAGVFLASLAFLVKLPVFFLHSWLPRAHVEAPVEGSVILAGVMLKMGFYGIVRFFRSSAFVPWVKLFSFFQSVSLFGAVFGFLIALSSDDMKKSVAYSSIAHMNFSLGTFCFPTEKVLESSWMMMMAHGLSASLLFWMVTVVYQATSSRSLMVSKGSMSKFSEVQLVFFSIWVLNISVPPLFPFLGEVGSVASLFLGLPVLGGVMSFSFIVLGSLFSVVNYFMICHSSSKLLLKMCPRSILLLGGGGASVMISFFLFFFPQVLLPWSG
nr:NADH dehydrogenase subunit 4 [Quadraceps punctatus]